jgi:heme/copper-type cytochrome/quinol oxidase subunit 4
MSLTDPTARANQRDAVIRPVAWVLAILALATAPFLVAIIEAVPASQQVTAWITCMFSFIGACLVFGLLLYYTAAHRNGLGITAYTFAYVAGLIFILGSARDPKTGLPDALYPALVIYAVSAVLLIIYISHALGSSETMKDGVETTATVTAAGVNGMVNYVTHWRLTLKFTDQQGHDRWFHLGRTGYGYAVGQTFTIKYNPKRPGSRRGIVVLEQSQFESA